MFDTELYEECPAPGFTAYSYSGALTTDTAMPWDGVTIDTRNSFDLESNRYICPTPGMYVFQSSLLTDSTYSATPDLRILRDATATTGARTSSPLDLR